MGEIIETLMGIGIIKGILLGIIFLAVPMGIIIYTWIFLSLYREIKNCIKSKRESREQKKE